MKERKALVVEDDPELMQLVRFALAELGYGCLTANCLEKALNLLSSIEPEIVVLDVGLPDGNGLELLTKLRQDPRLRQALVVVLSAATRIGDMEHALALGADDYVFKPASIERITQAIAQCLGRRRAVTRAAVRPSSLPVLEMLRSLIPSSLLPKVAKVTSVYPSIPRAPRTPRATAQQTAQAVNPPSRVNDTD